MSVSSTASAIRYTGNGSTVTGYAIPFPFLDPSHIYAAVSSNGVLAPVLLSPSAYTVTGSFLYTVAAVTAPAEIVVFRSTPLTQPTEFQLAGPFPSEASETALDRLTMQVQELRRRVNELADVDDGDILDVPTGGGFSGGDVPTWANPAARAAVAPAKAGQLGVEVSTQTIWIGQGTTAGAWEEFAPRRTGRLVIGLLADPSPVGSYQIAAVDLLDSWAPDAVLIAGGGNNTLSNADDSSAANYDLDWAAFSAYVSGAKLFPALGPVDVDGVGWAARHSAKFPYLPGTKRYYSKVLGDGLVEIFVLHTGFNSIRDLVETDGNEVGSVQHTWFVSALAASRARWKIAVYSQPPVTLATGDSKTAPEMAWPELAGVDLICCGNVHLLELLKWSDTMVANLSAVAYTNGTPGSLQGTGTATAWPLFSDGVSRGMGRIVATQDALRVEVYDLDGQILAALGHDDFSPAA